MQSETHDPETDRPSPPSAICTFLSLLSNASFWHIFFFFAFVCIGAAGFFIGAVPTRIFGHDIFVMLDNGWRVIEGQRPHVDWHSPWGPVTFLTTACGLRMAGYSVNGVGYGSTLFALAVGLWSYGLGSKGFTAFPRVSLAFLLTLMAVAPYPLGYLPSESSHAMVYNRYSYAILGLILQESFRVFDGFGWRQHWIGGISSGIAVAVLLFLKANFFFVALIPLGYSLVICRPLGWRLLGLSAGFALTTFALLAYLRFDVGAMIADLKMAAGARMSTAGAGVVIWQARLNASHLLSIVMLGLAASLGGYVPRRKYWAVHLPALAALAYTCDMVLLASNQQGSALPVIAVVSLLIANAVLVQHSKADRAGVQWAPAYATSVILFASALFLPQMVADAAGVAHGAWSKARPGAVPVRFQEPRLASLFLYDAKDHASNGGEYTTYVNEGEALLRSFSRPSETVMTLDMANPFPYALNREPPRGGIASAVYNATLSDAHHLSDDAFFGSTDLLMVPKRPALQGEEFGGLQRMYEAGLHQRFVLAAESEWWWLYRRR